MNAIVDICLPQSSSQLCSIQWAFACDLLLATSSYSLWVLVGGWDGWGKLKCPIPHLFRSKPGKAQEKHKFSIGKSKAFMTITEGLELKDASKDWLSWLLAVFFFFLFCFERRKAKLHVCICARTLEVAECVLKQESIVLEMSSPCVAKFF